MEPKKKSIQKHGKKKKMRAKARQNEKHASSSMAKINKSSISTPNLQKATRDEYQENEAYKAPPLILQ